MRLRLISLVPVAAAAALVLSSCAVFEPAAAVVGPHKVDHDEFRADLAFLLADPRFAEQAPGVDAEVQRQQIIHQVLTFLVQQQVIDERARDEGIEATEEEIGSFLEQQVAQLGGEDAFRQQIEDSEATVADVRELLRAQIVRDKVARSVVEEEVTEDELLEAYEDRAREFTRVHVAHILVRGEQTAENLADRATAGNFARLARRFSQDEGSADEGGDLGVHPAVEFVEPFANAVLEIPVGEVGGPVETDFGFHVIRVLEREVIPFEEVREQLLQEQGGEVFNDWLVERLQEAGVRVNPRYGIFDPETGQVVERTATTPRPEPQVTP